MNISKITSKIQTLKPAIQNKTAQIPQKTEFLGTHAKSAKPSLREDFIQAADELLEEAAIKILALVDKFKK